jgi:hypothetical protein
MRLRLFAALLAGTALAFVQAAPPKKIARPATRPAPSKALPDIPAAGAGGELLDLDTGRSRAIGAMQENRADFQATDFPDGRILITGGSLKGGSCEWFDPALRRFTAGPAMAQARQGHRALRLKDGRLLVVGGTEPPAPAEILDPGTWKFQPLSGGVRFALSADAVETDEGVLLIDGQEGMCWLWDGKGKGPKSTGGLGQARILFKATRLGDGRVLVTGGWPTDAQVERRKGRPVPSKSVSASLPAEIFNPRKGRWSAWKAKLQPRARPQSALLPDGRVVLFGGSGASAEASEETLEILDPGKETVTLAGKLLPTELPAPGWAGIEGGGYYLAERSTSLRKITGMEDWLRTASTVGHLANAYLAPVLVPLKGRQLLVLGAAVWGPALERWDPRTRQCQYIGALRAGAESLLLLEGRVVAVGPIVDAVDPQSGNLTALGWREDFTDSLKKAPSTRDATFTGVPPFPPGKGLRDSLVIRLDAQKALVLGGRSEAFPEGTDQVWVWDRKKKVLASSGPMKAKRVFSGGSRAGQGALKLVDGSVLIWSGP